VKEQYNWDHKIPQCFQKAIPQSKGLREAINSPQNLRKIPIEIHRKIDAEVPKIYFFLLKEFRHKKIKETIIYIDKQY
jgi:hypothetical protein